TTNAKTNPIEVEFLAGEGVGTVTKPGLALAVGEPAINPVPRQMIIEALTEAVRTVNPDLNQVIRVTIQVPGGKLLAEKTLNHRLGIVGGISILGTTGIVKPVSAEAWTATIEASMDVARQTECTEIVLSTGRTSEKGVQKIVDLPIEAFAMMGDYLQFSLEAAQKRFFTKIHLAAMWAKVMKAAMGIGQTHVRHGALEVEEAAAFIGTISKEPSLGKSLASANTAREIYQRLLDSGRTDVVKKVCLAAKNYAEKTSGLPVNVYLIDSTMKVVEHV
nr:cobalt-precorrin-5B (C(1))-methyltransferase [Desulfobulbaceae bacterium]